MRIFEEVVRARISAHKTPHVEKKSDIFLVNIFRGQMFRRRRNTFHDRAQHLPTVHVLLLADRYVLVIDDVMRASMNEENSASRDGRVRL